MKIEEIFDGIAKYKEIHILTEALKLHVFKWYEDSRIRERDQCKEKFFTAGCFDGHGASKKKRIALS